jgi:hypothetical protein
MRAWAFALLFGCGCGAAISASQAPQLSASVILPAQIAGDVSRIQILFAASDQVSCSAYNSAAAGCFKIAALGPVAKSATFPFAVAGSATGDQTFTVGGVPPGKNYSVIVEAANAAGALTGRGCAVTNAQVRPGSNEAVTVLLVQWSGSGCVPF